MSEVFFSTGSMDVRVAAKNVFYEQPLNERLRNCLRLESLFGAINEGIERGRPHEARDVVTRILELTDFINRSDFKGELVKEIERALVVCRGFLNNPGVDALALEETLKRLEGSKETLRGICAQPGNVVKNDELLNLVRQRISIPGGTCSFDVPAFYHWLCSPQARRTSDCESWMLDLRGIETAVQTILNLTRASSQQRSATAYSGFYQEQASSGVTLQLVRIGLPSAATVYPEISGGKHRFTVRFYELTSTQSRPSQTENDISFLLECCGL